VIGHHVIDEMGIDRRPDRPPPGLDVGEKPQQRRQIVAFREPLALHQVFALEHRVGKEKAVGGDEIDLGHIGPARQQRLQHARRRRLAHRDRAGDADHIGHLGIRGRDEALLGPEQALGRRDI